MLRHARLALLTLSAALTPALASGAGLMYWTDVGNIYRSNLDGTNVATIMQASATNGIAGWMDIDFDLGKIYFRGWADSTNKAPFSGVVRSLNMDGTGLQDVVTGIGFGAYGMDLDVTRKILFYGDHTTATIYRANYDGSGITPLQNATGLRHTHGMRVLESEAKIYYTNGEFQQVGGFNGIRMANLDGSDTESVLDMGTEQLLAGYVAFDEFNGKLYSSRWEDGTIYRSNLDGSDRELFLSGFTDVLDMAIDSLNGHLYFTSASKIQRVNLDGTGIVDLVSLGSERLEKSIVLDLRAVPEPSSVFMCLTGLIGSCVLALRQSKLGESKLGVNSSHRSLTLTKEGNSVSVHRDAGDAVPSL